MFVKPRIIIVLLFSICITYGQNYRSVCDNYVDITTEANDPPAYFLLDNIYILNCGIAMAN